MKYIKRTRGNIPWYARMCLGFLDIIDGLISILSFGHYVGYYSIVAAINFNAKDWNHKNPESESGQGFVEYLLISLLIIVILIIVVAALGDTVQQFLTNVMEGI